MHVAQPLHALAPLKRTAAMLFSRPLRLRSGQALRDEVRFLAVAPGVETPGYDRASS
jgi:hypothetical protein